MGKAFQPLDSCWMTLEPSRPYPTETMTQRETTLALLDAIEAQKQRGQEFQRRVVAQDVMKNQDRAARYHAEYLSQETFRTIEANRHMEACCVREAARASLERQAACVGQHPGRLRDA